MSKPPSDPPAAARSRGRPPKPGGPKSPAEIQRAYRARLAAAGKVVRIVHAGPASPLPAAFPEFDPERDGIGICEPGFMITGMGVHDQTV